MEDLVDPARGILGSVGPRKGTDPKLLVRPATDRHRFLGESDTFAAQRAFEFRDPVRVPKQPELHDKLIAPGGRQCLRYLGSIAG